MARAALRREERLALLKEVGKNEEEIDRLLEKYTYTETVTRRELDQNGQLRDKESEKFELTFFRLGGGRFDLVLRLF